MEESCWANACKGCNNLWDEILLVIGDLRFPTTYSEEYLFRGFPRVCLKGRLYPTEVFILSENRVDCIP